MKRWMLSISVFCVLVIAIFSSAREASAQAKTLKLTFSHLFPVGHPNTNLIAEWGKEVEKRTNGRATVVVFPSGTLTPADQCYEGVVKGISDLGSAPLSYTRGRFPFMEILDLPLGHKNALVSTRLANAFYKKFQPRELNDVKVMYFGNPGPGILHTKKEVRKLEDLKGLRLRCSGVTAKVVVALGGIPVALTMPETYDALSKGLVEGVIGVPMGSLAAYRWGEVIKCTVENFGSAMGAAMFVAMNKKTWNTLPADIREIIEGINQEWIDKNGRAWDNYDETGRAFTLKLGNKIIPLSKEEDERWAKQLNITFDDYIKDMKKRGLPGGDEAVQFCRDFLRTNR